MFTNATNSFREIKHELHRYKLKVPLDLESDPLAETSHNIPTHEKSSPARKR